jgi:ABC-2 type transport system permease protein
VVSELVAHVDLYRRLVGARARSQMQYRFAFAMLLLGNVTATIADFIGVLVLFSRIPNLVGWSIAEVSVMFGLALASFGLAEVFAPGFDLFARQIVQGGFDRVLTRPVGAFFQTLAADIALRKFARLAQGLVIIAIAQGAVPVHWSLGKVVAIAIAVPSGGALFFSIFVMGAASTFWTVRSNEAVNIFTNGGLMMMEYPLDIYSVWLRRFVTFVLPLGFVSYYPALYLLDRPDPLGLPPWIGLLSPIAAVAFGVVAAGFWSLGVRHYQSTGT